MEKKVLPRLPWELSIYIFTFIGTSHLVPVILTCQAMRGLAEPLLYRHLDLWNCPTRSLYLFRTLLAREDLCRHVRTFVPTDYHLKADGLFDTLKWLILKKKEKYKRGGLYLQLAMQVAAKLKHAESISTSTPSARYVQMLSGLSEIKRFRTTSAFGFRGLVENLFDAIPKVTHLELPFDMLPLHGFVIHPHHAQFLQELVCPATFAPRIVPGRPIHRLILRWPRWADGPNVSELMEEMAQSSETIRRLGLLIGWRVNLQADIEEIFSATARFLPDVEELTVWLELWKGRTHLLERLMRKLSENLVHFSKLRVLDFNGSIGYGVAYFDHQRNAISTAYTTTLESWLRSCPTLEKVIFPNGAVWVKQPTIHPSTRTRRRTLLPLSRPTSLLHLVDANPAEGEMGLAESDTSKNDRSTVVAHPNQIQVLDHPARTKPSTGHKWRCLNPYFPKSNRPAQSYVTRTHKPELGWGVPTFETDLKKCWPEDLAISNLT